MTRASTSRTASDPFALSPSLAIEGSIHQQGKSHATGPQGRSTSRYKKVPENRALREQIRAGCDAAAAKLDKRHRPTKAELEAAARTILADLGLPEHYLGWTMVFFASAFWRDQVAAVPPSRRLLLLSHCLRHSKACPADYNAFGLECQSCGACRIADFRQQAENLGYRVLIAEGTPIVMKIILSTSVDAILGVACLNVLEKAIDKVFLAGVPCMAVPLLTSNCCDSSVDEDWIEEMIQVKHAGSMTPTQTYIHLMRLVGDMFEPNELERLAPRVRNGPRLAESNGDGLADLDPIAVTEAIAYDFLAKGGKYSRPFVTLAAYDALTGARCTGANGAEYAAEIPDAIRRTALSIEIFHKASLVHDDIEDNDAFRYGEPTIHHAHGIPTAINVGDYLIGMGYRLVSRDALELGSDTAIDILDRLADAHLRLSEGQGAELAWRDARNKRLTPLDALKIYTLKTAPAFEAALYSGIRLAGPAVEYMAAIRQFARYLGVAFQILNDLKDWQGDRDNKLTSNGDVLGGRPTVLLALALENLQDSDQNLLLDILSAKTSSSDVVEQVRELYVKADAFQKAQMLVDRYQARTEEIAKKLTPPELHTLAMYLIDTILCRTVEPERTIFHLASTMPT